MCFGGSWREQVHTPPLPSFWLGCWEFQCIRVGLGNLAEMLPYSSRTLWSLLGGQEAVSLLFASLYCVLALSQTGVYLLCIPILQSSEQERQGEQFGTQSRITKLRQKNKGEKCLVSQTIGGKGKTHLAKLMACRCSSKQFRYLGEMNTCMQAPTCMKGDSIPH